MKHPRLILAAALALSSAAGRVQAADFHFNVPTGDWNTAASWLENAVPGTGGGNFAFVNNGGTADIPVIQDPFIGRGADNSGTVNHSAGNHNNVGWVFVGDQGGTGTYNLTGAANTLGSGSLNTGRIQVGNSRTGQTGGNGTMRVNTTGTVTATSDLSVATRGAPGLRRRAHRRRGLFNIGCGSDPQREKNCQRAGRELGERTSHAAIFE